MRVFTLLAAILLGLAITLPAAAQGDKKKESSPLADLLGGKKKEDAKPKVDVKKTDDKKPDDKKSDDAKKKLKFGAVFGGKLTKLDQGRLTVQISGQVKVAYSDAANRLASYQRSVANYQRDLIQRKLSLARILNDINRTRDAGTRARRLRDYQREANRAPPRPPQPPQLYRMETKSADVIVRMGKEMIIRSSSPELQFDDKGFPVKFTPEKLKELQGPEGHPGFPAGLGDLGVNTQVTVYLAAPEPKKKEKKGPNIADILGGNDAAGAKQEDALVDTRYPEVVMIMVMQSPVTPGAK